MRRFTLGPGTFFRLSAAALAFALGLACAALWPRGAAHPPTPRPAAPAPARATVSVRDTFADKIETEEALKTPPSKYERDRVVLEEMRAAWDLQPVERGCKMGRAFIPSPKP